MDDPSVFSTILEYKAAYYAIAVLCISELLIWFFTSRSTRGEHRKSADSGTIWLVVIGWCWGVTAGAFFRSNSVPQFIRNWILPHFCYYVGTAFNQNRSLSLR